MFSHCKELKKLKLLQTFLSRSLGDLYSQFDDFSEEELFAVGNNQSPYYFLATQVIEFYLLARHYNHRFHHH